MDVSSDLRELLLCILFLTACMFHIHIHVHIHQRVVKTVCTFSAYFACGNTSKYPHRSFIFVLTILFCNSYHTNTTLDSGESVHTYTDICIKKNPVQTVLITTKL